MKEGMWEKWATWLYNIDDGKTACLRHLHGRTWRGKDEVYAERCAVTPSESHMPTSETHPLLVMTERGLHGSLEDLSELDE